jgi:hypothetical protein
VKLCGNSIKPEKVPNQFGKISNLAVASHRAFASLRKILRPIQHLNLIIPKNPGV